MYKYASHATYCFLLGTVSQTALIPEHPEPALFLQALCVWCTTCLALCITYDAFHNVTSMGMVWPLKKPFDSVAALQFLLAAGLNMVYSATGMAIARVVLGVHFWHELWAAVFLMIAYNGDALIWIARAPPEAYSFYKERGWDLTKRMWWSMLLRQIGLATTKTSKRVVAYALSVWMMPHTPALPNLLELNGVALWAAYAAWTVGVCYVRGLEGIPRYYYAHRWLHNNPTLYLCIHKVHHVSKYPIPSDLGTESPMEHSLTNGGGFEMMMPLWPWLIYQILIALPGQHAAHDFTQRVEDPRNKPTVGVLEKEPGLDHRLHHSVNKGEYGSLDALQNTTINRKDRKDHEFGLHNLPKASRHGGIFVMVPGILPFYAPVQTFWPKMKAYLRSSSCAK